MLIDDIRVILEKGNIDDLLREKETIKAALADGEIEIYELDEAIDECAFRRRLKEEDRILLLEYFWDYIKEDSKCGLACGISNSEERKKYFAKIGDTDKKEFLISYLADGQHNIIYEISDVALEIMASLSDKDKKVFLEDTYDINERVKNNSKFK